MKTVNDYAGQTDNDRIEAAIKDRENGTVILPRRVSNIEPERDWWLLERAIVLPEDTVFILDNCRVKISDSCRDNFFRSANCGLGIADPAPIRRIHIIGRGEVVLEGADKPRSTGDGSKILANPCPRELDDLILYADWVDREQLKKDRNPSFNDVHSRSFGTDAGKPNESQYGDWRNIGILLANVDGIRIENLRIINSHGWAISLEACSNAKIHDIDFVSDMSRFIDGMSQNSENQDGIDLRNGCHDIIISNITGTTGDDVVALTAIANPDRPFYPGGSFRTTHVMHSDWKRRNPDIYNVIVQNILAHPAGGCCNVRLLPCGLARIYNVTVDHVVDTCVDGPKNCFGIILGENDDSYGVNRCMSEISITNCILRGAWAAISQLGYLKNSIISGIINLNPGCETVYVRREDGMDNVLVESSVRSKE